MDCARLNAHFPSCPFAWERFRITGKNAGEKEKISRIEGLLEADYDEEQNHHNGAQNERWKYILKRQPIMVQFLLFMWFYPHFEIQMVGNFALGHSPGDVH
jgi:hypothetical protein